MNVLDYTAVVVPVTKVDKEVDKFDEAYKPLGELDKLVWSECEFFFNANARERPSPLTHGFPGNRRC